MVLGSAISIFAKDAIHNSLRSLKSVIQAFHCRCKIRVSAGQSVLCAVKSPDFLLCGNPKADGLIYDKEYDCHKRSRPDENRRNSKALHTEKLCASRIQQSFKPCRSLWIC